MAPTDSRKIRVGILGYGLDRPATGIARYTVEIARTLAANHPEISPVLLLPFDGTVSGLEPLERVRLRLVRLLPGLMMFGPAELALTARRHALDVVHDPTGVAPFIAQRRLGGCATVVTIHDMVPFVHPETHARLTNVLFHRYMPATLRFVDRIITVSDASKRDIVKHYRLDDERIDVIHGGVSDHFSPQPADLVDRVRQKYQICPRYILCVGALSARKNLETALDAYAELRSRGVNHHLVLVGPKSWKNQGIFRRIEELGLGDHVSFTGFVDDADLPVLYSGAACFVFPSLYEGFGLPPLEAMACGTPVVASNSSSIPEVTGDAALSASPRDAAGFANAIGQILGDPALAGNLRSRGLTHVQQFTWTRAAARHADLYRQLIFAKDRSTT